MIEQSSFKKVRVYSRMILGKVAALEVQRANGKFTSSSRVGNFNMVNAGNVLALSAAQTLTREDSGKHVLLDLAGGFTVTLPPLEAGLKFKFTVITAPTTAYIVDSAEGDNMHGMILNRAGVAGVAGSAEDQLNFVASQAIVGDTVDMSCDGTSWYFTGWANVAAGITATDPS